jgi:hypothetical protein
MVGETQPTNLSPLQCPQSAHLLFRRVSTEFYCSLLETSLICKIDGPLVATIDFFTGQIIEIFYILGDAEDQEKNRGSQRAAVQRTTAYHFSGQDFSNAVHRISDNEGVLNRIFHKIIY